MGLRKKIYRARWGPLPVRLEYGLKRLYDTLLGTPFHNKYWMNGGLLLGCVRHGGPLPHDTDADFSFWDSDQPQLFAGLRALQARGFRLLPGRHNNDGTQTKWALMLRGVKFEFYRMQCVGDKMRWISHLRKPPLEMVNEVPLHRLDELSLYGRTWLKPDDHETYLRSLYGDWRTPNPSYCYWKDSRAIVRRYAWKEAVR